MLENVSHVLILPLKHEQITLSCFMTHILLQNLEQKPTHNELCFLRFLVLCWGPEPPSWAVPEDSCFLCLTPEESMIGSMNYKLKREEK